MNFIQSKTETLSIDTSDLLPIKFNCDSQGFYVINYHLDDWKRWTELFRTEQELEKKFQLTQQDYVQLLYDSYRLANADLLTFEIVFELLRSLSKIEMPVIWQAVYNILDDLWTMFAETNFEHSLALEALIHKHLQQFGQNLVQKIYLKYGLASVDGDPQQQRLRKIVSQFSCQFGLRLCLLESQTLYRRWQLDHSSSISPNTKAVILKHFIQQSNDSNDWFSVWNELERENSNEIRLIYIAALAETKSSKLLKLYAIESIDRF